MDVYETVDRAAPHTQVIGMPDRRWKGHAGSWRIREKLLELIAWGDLFEPPNIGAAVGSAGRGLVAYAFDKVRLDSHSTASTTN